MSIAGSICQIFASRAGHRLAAATVCLLVLPPAVGRDLDMDEWIVRLGEAAAEASPASNLPPLAAEPARDCFTLATRGEMVLRAGSPCSTEHLADVVRTATRSMNARHAGRDCRGLEACRRNLREERLKQVASLNYEQGQMARRQAASALQNVSVPPTPPTSPSASSIWVWRPYR
jgi:hypothetical protein